MPNKGSQISRNNALPNWFLWQLISKLKAEEKELLSEGEEG